VVEKTEAGVKVGELREGSQRGRVVAVRAKAAYGLNGGMGISNHPETYHPRSCYLQTKETILKS
jgi:hypothetical protein